MPDGVYLEREGTSGVEEWAAEAVFGGRRLAGAERICRRGRVLSLANLEIAWVSANAEEK